MTDVITEHMPGPTNTLMQRLETELNSPALTETRRDELLKLAVQLKCALIENAISRRKHSGKLKKKQTEQEKLKRRNTQAQTLEAKKSDWDPHAIRKPAEEGRYSVDKDSILARHPNAPAPKPDESEKQRDAFLQSLSGGDSGPKENQ